MKGIAHRSNFIVVSIMVLLFLIHLPIVFASPRTSKTNTDISNEIHSSLNSYADLSNMALMFGVYDSLQLEQKGLSKKVFEYALRGFNRIRQSGMLDNQSILSIADFSQSSSSKRLFILDVLNRKLLFNTYVAHGMRSGKEFATAFSNKMSSNRSSLGFYKTATTYNGENGYSLRLIGLERGFNDNAFKRDIVMHPADYVNENFIRTRGWIGRSWGCPAVPRPLSKPIIDQIKDGSCLFIYASDKNYLKRSSMLKEMQDVAVR